MTVKVKPRVGEWWVISNDYLLGPPFFGKIERLEWVKYLDHLENTKLYIHFKDKFEIYSDCLTRKLTDLELLFYQLK